VGRQHLGAAHDQAVLGFFDNAEIGIRIGLLRSGLAAVDRRIDQRVGKEDVVVATVAIVALHVVGEFRIALGEHTRFVGHRHQHRVEEIRRTPHGAEARVGPCLHRFAAMHQVGVAARNNE
jgi:hypothetical protein